ncbi:MAG: hypothetical protein Q7R57_05570 [Dehalococcoidales bacterium]|nr:hypothetical protein [Dehalococcoidales bacterium]
MKTLKRVINRIGGVAVGLVAALFFPLLIWVALAIAARQKLKAKKLERSPRPTVDQLLAEAGLSYLDGKGTKVKVG